MAPKEHQETKSSSTSVVDKSRIAALLGHAVFCQAAELARMGRYDAAEQVVAANSGADTPAALDLLARIRAQQGRLVEAQALWSQAVRLDPDNESYRSGLQRLTVMNRQSWWGYLSKRLALGVVAILVISIFVMRWHRSWLQERGVVPSEARTALPPTGKIIDQQIGFQIVGVSQHVEGNDVVLRFDSGLFKTADILTPQAKTLLTKIGQQINSLPSRLSISILGLSDDRPLTTHIRFRDNRLLALARAQAVAEFLASSTGIPAGQFTIRNAKGSIYPNDTARNRAKNRSVEIFISKQGD